MTAASPLHSPSTNKWGRRKKYLKRVSYFSSRNNDRHETTFSPQKHHVLHTTFPKTPLKNAHKQQNPPQPPRSTFSRAKPKNHSAKRRWLNVAKSGEKTAPINLPPTRNRMMSPNIPMRSYNCTARYGRKCRRMWLPSSGGIGIRLKTKSNRLITMTK